MNLDSSVFLKLSQDSGLSGVLCLDYLCIESCDISFRDLEMFHHLSEFEARGSYHLFEDLVVEGRNRGAGR